MESREKIRTLSGFDSNAGEGESTEPGPAREAFIKLFDEVAKEGIQVLKKGEHHRLPATVEQLSSTTKKEIDDLVQRQLAQWRKLKEDK